MSPRRRRTSSAKLVEILEGQGNSWPAISCFVVRCARAVLPPVLPRLVKSTRFAGRFDFCQARYDRWCPSLSRIRQAERARQRCRKCLRRAHHGGAFWPLRTLQCVFLSLRQRHDGERRCGDVREAGVARERGDLVGARIRGVERVAEVFSATTRTLVPVARAPTRTLSVVPDASIAGYMYIVSTSAEGSHPSSKSGRGVTVTYGRVSRR
jgi:hypothetical protein